MHAPTYGYPRRVITRVAIAAILLLVAGAVAWRLERRPKGSGALPVRTGDRAHVPAQVDRADFPRPDAPWLLVLFTSAECGGCAEMSTKIAVLATGDVAVCEIEYSQRRDLQEKYSVDAVPLSVVADAEGVVRAHAFGNVPASDLWATVARAREVQQGEPGGSSRSEDADGR